MGCSGRQVTPVWVAVYWPVVSRVAGAVRATRSACAGHLPGGGWEGRERTPRFCVTEVSWSQFNIWTLLFKIKVGLLSAPLTSQSRLYVFKRQQGPCRPRRGPASSAACCLAVSFQYLFSVLPPPCYKLLRRDHRLLAPRVLLPRGHHLIYCCTCRRDCFCIFAIKNFLFDMVPVCGRWCGWEPCILP